MLKEVPAPTVSLAQYASSRFSTAAIQTKPEELVAVWEAALGGFTSEEARFGFIDATSLAEFARLAPSHDISRDKSAAAAAQPCLWLIDTLLKTGNRPADVSLAQHIANIQSATDSKAQLQDPQASPTSRAVDTALSLSALFHTMLLLKLAQLLASVANDAVDLRSVEEAIWKLLSCSLNSYRMLSTYGGSHQTELSAIKLLVEMLIASARQILSTRVQHQQQHARKCLEMLNYLFTRHGVTPLGIATSTEMLRQGVLTVLVTALNKSLQSAVCAAEVMGTLLLGSNPFTAGEAEAILCGMSERHRLCNLLCPPFSKQEREDLVLQGPAVFGPQWVPATFDLKSTKTAVLLIMRLQAYDPRPPADRTQRFTGFELPTPSQAEWTAIKAAASKTLIALWWHRRNPEASSTADDSFSFEAVLGEIIQNLLLGHILNPKLDVQLILKLCCKAMLCDWDPLGKNKGTFALMYAVMIRLGHSPERLQLPPHKSQLNSAHNGHDCPGCNRCSGPDWQWKTEAVASLLPYFCQYVAVDKQPDAAAVMVNALYAAVDDDQHCQHILRGTQTGPEAHLMGHNRAAFLVALKAFDTKSPLQLTAMLNASACLARLCDLELANKAKPDWREKGSTSATAWWKQTELNNGFAHMLTAISLAFQAAVPWSTERCVALTRALYRCGRLHADMPNLYIENKEAGADVLTSFATYVAHYDKVNSDEQLCAQLLVNSFYCLVPALAQLKKHSEAQQATSQRLPFVMTDLGSKLPTVDCFLPDGKPPSYPSFGLSQDSSTLWQLRSAWVTFILPTLVLDTKSMTYFDTHMAKQVKAWFALGVAQPLGAGPVADLCLDPMLENLSYFAMFEMFSHGVYKHSGADAQSAQALLQCLYCMTNTLVRMNKRFREVIARKRSASSPALGDKEAALDLKDEQCALAARIELIKELQGKTLATLDCLSKNAAWALALSQAADSGLWSAKPEDHSTLKQHLAQDRAQLQGQIQRIESYFRPQASAQASSVSPAKLTAIEELLAEEEQGAAQAAAKKAKKQRQKAKKQQEEQERLQKQQHQQQQQSCRPKPAYEQQQPDDVEPLISMLADARIAEEPSSSNGVAAAAEPVDKMTQMQGIEVEEAPQEGVQDASGGDDDFLRDLFTCPLTKVLFQDPVIAADGFSYERAALKTWLVLNSTSPVTGRVLPHKRIVDNVTIRNLMSVE